VERTLKLRPNDPEAAQLKASINAGHISTSPEKQSPTGATSSGFDPLERIRRTYSEASFRQAAFQLDQMRSVRMAALSPAEQAVQYTQLGHDYFIQGLIPEAEQQFQAAIAADSSNAAAHAGLAQVRERSGSETDARAEAQTSIRLRPNAAAYVILARLDLQANHLVEAASNVGNALRLEPKDSAALGMRQALQTRGQSIP
jgi:Tfp pilus assembly protein PilF